MQRQRERPECGDDHRSLRTSAGELPLHEYRLRSDPFRSVSLRLLETMEAAGWTITLNKWSVGEDAAPRPIGVYELVAP